MLPFAETCLRLAAEYCIATVAAPECVQALVVVDVVKVRTFFFGFFGTLSEQGMKKTLCILLEVQVFKMRS